LLAVILLRTSLRLKVVNPSVLPSSSHCISETLFAIGFGFTSILKLVKPKHPESKSSILTNISVGVGEVLV